MARKKVVSKEKGVRSRSHKFNPLVDVPARLQQFQVLIERQLIAVHPEIIPDDDPVEVNEINFDHQPADGPPLDETDAGFEYLQEIDPEIEPGPQPPDLLSHSPGPASVSTADKDSLNRPCSEECPITPLQILALIMSLASRAHLANTTTSDILAIFGLLFPKEVHFPSSFDQLKTCLRSRDLLDDYVNFYLCLYCGSFITETEPGSSDFVCENDKCNAKFDRKSRPVNMVYLPVTSFLKHAIESGEARTSADISLVKDQGYLSTFVDGITYARIEKEMGGQEFICVTLSSDDAQTSLSSTSNIWIGQIAIADPDCLPKPRVHTMLSKTVELTQGWDSPKDLVQKLNTPVVAELVGLGLTGIDVVKNGQKRNIKVKVLCYSCDSKERGPALGIGPHNAVFGCCHCEFVTQQFALQKGSKKIYPFKDKVKENDLPFRDPKITRQLAKKAARYHRRVKELKRLNEKLKAGGLKLQKIRKSKKRLEEMKNILHPTVLSKLPNFHEFHQTPVEPMHNGAEGVCKMLILLTVPVQNEKSAWRLGDRFLVETSDFMLSMTPPSKLQRHFRPMAERVKQKWKTTVKQWKMNELHSFGLMAALPVYYGRLKPDQFALFARFVAISQYLYSGRIRKSDYKLLQSDMIQFGIDLQKSITEEHMSYNLHQWCTHFLKYVFFTGPPRSFWGFENENLIGVCGRRQKQFQNIQKEIMGKTTMAECSKRLEKKYLDCETSNADLDLLVRSICHTLQGSKLSVRTEAGSVYCFGAHETLRTFKNRNPDEELLEKLLVEKLELPLENYVVWIYRACRSENGIKLRGDLTAGKIGITLKRDDSAYVDGGDKFAKVKRIITVRKKFNHGGEGFVFIYGIPAKFVQWHEFGFADDPVLKKDFYRKYYRCFEWLPKERVLQSTAHCKESVFVINGQYVNGIPVGSLLGIPLFPFSPN